MIRRLWGIINKDVAGLNEAAYILAVFTFLSQILGFVRDRLLASIYGPSQILDVYYASFRVPDVLFVITSSIVSAAVLVPIFTEKKDKPEDLKKTSDSIFSFMIACLVLVGVFVFFFAPQILKWFVPTLYNGAEGETLVLFTKILILSPILLCISQVLGSIIQANRRFMLSALSPVLYNFGIVLGVAVLAPIFGNIGLVMGVVVGLLFHVLIQVPTVFKWKLMPKLTMKWHIPSIKKVVGLSLPRAFALSVTQIVIFYMVSQAARIAEGSVSIFTFAFNLQSVPMSIVGVSYSVAAFPTLSRFFAEGKKEDFVKMVGSAAKYILFWSLPIIALFIVLRAHIVRTILGGGEFTWSDTTLTAAALALFTISVAAQSLVLLFLRVFYASGETRAPLLLTVFSNIFTVFLANKLLNFYENSSAIRIFFEKLMRVYEGTGTELLMLPLAFSLGAILNAILLWALFEKRFGHTSQGITESFIKSALASITVVIASYVTLQILSPYFDLKTTASVFTHGFIAGMAGIISGSIIFKLTKSQEFEDSIVSMIPKIWKKPEVVPDQETL